MNDRWSRLTRLGWALTIAGVIIIAIEGFLGGNTDLLGATFESTLVNLNSAADRVDDLIIVIRSHHLARRAVRPEPRRRRGIGEPTTLTTAWIVRNALLSAACRTL